MGRSECGKTTLTQAMRGEVVHYQKTQYVNVHDVVIDTPGEYAENKSLAAALALYSYEADVVGLLVSAIEPYSLYPPNVTTMCNRETIPMRIPKWQPAGSAIPDVPRSFTSTPKRVRVSRKFWTI